MTRVAIVGAGIGAEHLAGYRALPDRFRVAVMCDLDTARARAATADDPEIAVSDDLAPVLADPAIDLIDICLPPHLHFPLSLQVLPAGKHAICEKPLAPNAAEARASVEICRAHGVQLGIGHERRFETAMLEIERMVRGVALCACLRVRNTAAWWQPERPLAQGLSVCVGLQPL